MSDFTHNNKTGCPMLTPHAVSASTAARLYDVDVSTWWQWHLDERIPEPLFLGGWCRWRLDELQAWVAAGGPDLERWQAMREAGR